MVQVQPLLVSNDSEDFFQFCCHSTKTAQSIKPDANIKMSDPNLAELNGPFVVRILQQVFVSFGTSQVTEQNKRNVGSTMAGGLYMFFVMPQGSQEERYCPIYVGYTSRTFRQRFREHADNGVIRKFFDGQLRTTVKGAQKACYLYVSEFQYDAPAAKLLESVFLNAFDFALNVEENGAARDTVELAEDNPLETSYEVFVPQFTRVMEDVNTMKDRINHVINP